MSSISAQFQEYQKQLESLPDIPERIGILNRYSWELSRIDPIQAFILAEEANQLSQNLNHNIGIIISFRNLGQCYWLMSNLEAALEKSFACLSLLETCQDKVIEADALNIVGAVYSQLGDYENAQNYYFKCVEIRKILNDKEGEVRALNSIGDLYLKTKEYEKAEKQFLDCLDIEHENFVHKGIVLYNLGETSFYLKKEEKAFEYLNRSIKIGEEINFTLMKVYCSLMIGQIYLQKNDAETSIQYLTTALEAAKEVDSKERIYRAHKSLSEALRMKGDYKKALENHELYHKVKEEVFNQDNNQKIKTMQFQFQTQSLKKEAELERIKNLELQTAYGKIEKQRNEIEEKNKDITDSINYAQRIQQAILPGFDVLRENFEDAFVLYLPKDIISGDFYWFNSIKETVIVTVADCTGHGVPGAFMSMLGHSYLSQIVTDHEVTSPAKALTLLDKKISETLKGKNKEKDSNDGMDMALFAYYPKQNKIQFAGAKNSLYLIRNKEFHIYKGDKISIGGHDAGEKAFTDFEIQIQKGDILYMTTDGFADQFGGPNGKKFKESRLKETLMNIHHLSLSEQKEILNKTFLDWKANLEQVDDVCIIGVRL